MTNSRLRLPPLNALKSFHAAVRHDSIRAAADELLVTPQAVSQQIKLLEDTLQVTLFNRKGRSIEKTEAAIILARFVDAGFEELAEGVRRVTNQKYHNRITLNVSPYFATRYLLPRISHFREGMPDTDLRMTTMVDTPEFARDDIDVAVQWGYGDWKTYDTTLLLQDHKIITCTPDIAATIKSPSDLLDQTLLHPVLHNSLWSDVLAFLGVGDQPPASEIAFHDAATMRRATLSGMGIGLVSELDAINDVRAGDLIAPLGLDALKGLPPTCVPGFYLVLPKGHRRVNIVAKLCEWITSENWAEVPT